MRLLNARTYELSVVSNRDIGKYAILSHTWGASEVTLRDLETKTFDRKAAGFAKIRGCCQRAIEDGYEYVWIDTCCIDKSSSAELSEAINSMYSWYQRSAVCYAYLEDVSETTPLAKSRWFTRGWTLQELLAPRRVVLLDGQWRQIGTKVSRADEISYITHIPKAVLCGKSPLQCNIAQRMSWAARRETTREEDVAYCLLGLFDIHMPPIYGEGSEKAFLRLQAEILQLNSDQTLFLWTPSHEPYNQGLLATSPSAFCTHPVCFREKFRLTSKRYKDISTDEAIDNFDPYSLCLPLFHSHENSSYKDSRNSQKDQLSFPGSLGSNGLQVSLLAGHKPSPDRINGLLAQLTLVRFEVALGNKDQSFYIFLTLEPDIHVNYMDGYIPNGLGSCRRTPIMFEDSNYVLEPANLKFERILVTVSQFSTRDRITGSPVEFRFRHGKENLSGPDLSMIQPDNRFGPVSHWNEKVVTSGGFVPIRHPCSECNQENIVLLYFGTVGSHSDVWCYVELTDSIEESRALRRNSQGLSLRNTKELTFRVAELSVRRYQQSSNYMLPCHRMLFVDIRQSEIEDCYYVDLRIGAPYSY